MTQFLNVDQVLHLHDQSLNDTGGAPGLRDRGALESAVAQPQATFGGEDLYPTLSAKAAALAFGLANNHPFVDGNKRTAHASMEVFLVRNGYELSASVDEQEQVFLDVARGAMSREELAAWIEAHTVPRQAAS